MNAKTFSNFAPLTGITVSTILAVGLAVLSTMVTLSGPWLGVVFDRAYDGEGVRISSVSNDGPAASRLAAGDVIVALQTHEQGKVGLSPMVTLEDPDRLESYSQYNDFFSQQQRVWEVLSFPSFTAILKDGRRIELTPAKYPSPAVLPASFWWLIFFGGASFILGLSSWCMRRSEPVTRVLAISGFGFMLGAYSCGIYAARELALPSDFFFGLAALNHLGIMVFAYAAVLVFWYYPQSLSSLPAGRVTALWVTVLWANETQQWLSWPIHAFYAHVVVAYCMLVLFSSLQWRKSRGALLQRAMLKWLLIVVLLSMSFSILLFYVPIILTGKPIASNVLTFGAVFLFYLGLVIGNIRYRQFDMEHWWIRAWQWLVFIFIALISDVLFVYFLNMSTRASIELTLVVSFLYLFVRQWFWGRFSGKSSQALDRALPHLVETLIHQKGGSPDKQWHQLISRVFNPLSLKLIAGRCESVTIERGGMALQLPCLDGTMAIELFCCDQGKRLFSSADANLANRLLELMRHSQNLHMAHEEGVLEERHRIRRDLHDDVAARLLSLLHQSREPLVRKFAQGALRGLRDVIHLLGAEEASLADVMSDIEAGAREQLTGMSVNFEWRSPEHWPEVMLSSQQHINLRRIAREAIANALKHAHPGNIIVDVSLSANAICFGVCNDGAISAPSGWKPNRGLNNIRSRATEMGGSHKWSIEQREDDRQYCRLTVCVPLTTGENLEKHITG
ncbi:MAG TPA: hypothetical protein VGD24_07740 [Gallionella sp.]